ncbi:MAG: glycoside hydrolase family 95 protein [Mariniphaga sp.]|nr:glycoside hydrolase family 95 protein [Mariniphaga sp.]
MKMLRRENQIFIGLFIFSFFVAVSVNGQNHRLWYQQPAKYWNSQALHLGNGFIGASFFGGVEEEKFTLTEGSIWRGGPFRGDWEEFGVNPEANKYLEVIRQAVVDGDVRKADSLTQKYYLGQNKLYGAFSTIGDLNLKMMNHGMPHTNYVRELDLSKSLGHVSYVLDGVNYSREYFCSYPKNVLVMKLKADQPGKVGFAMYMDIIQERYNVDISADEYTVTGFVDGGDHKFQMKIRAVPYGGSPVQRTKLMGLANPYWGIQDADSVVLFINISTDYIQEWPNYKGSDPAVLCESAIRTAENAGYNALKNEHVADYVELYARTQIDLNSRDELNRMPTDKRYQRFKAGEQDLGLKELVFNLGRYMIISSSRPGSLPANLQGKWNAFYTAPWAGNYQANINIQEIYWPCGPTDLLECQIPYIDWTADLVKPGREVAKRVYGTDGWISHTTGNIWGHAAPDGSIPWGVYPLAPVWHCQHLWEQFTFSQDLSYLKNIAYPIIKEATSFWLQNLTKFGKYYIVAPSISAEHGAHVDLGEEILDSYERNSSRNLFNIPGAYQDAQMLRDLFEMYREAAEVLDVDKAFVKQVRAAQKKLLPHKIGKYGQLQEWYEDIDSPEDRHRHISHLYAVCPGNQIHPLTTPELAEAAKVSLNMRGEGRFPNYDAASGGNWSMCWRIWCWTRLMDGNRANKIFDQMLREQGFENLLTFQQAGWAGDRPDLFREPENLFLNFQLDGSASTPGFMAEMLLQSHLDEIILLPALPEEWENGSVKGLKARGNFSIDISWENGELTDAQIKSNSGNIPKIRLVDKYVDPQKDNRIRLIKN